MKGFRFGTSSVVFVIFFGSATIETVQKGHFLEAVLWLGIGTVFLIADNVSVKQRLNYPELPQVQSPAYGRNSLPKNGTRTHQQGY
jgi:hypothetical protein